MQNCSHEKQSHNVYLIASVSSPGTPDTVTIMFSTKTKVFAQAMTDRQTLVKPKNNETEPYSNNLSPSEEWNRIFDSYSGSQANQSALPSFGEAFENTSPNFAKKPEIPAIHAKVEECSENVDKISKTLATILPGVIRHTSHPDRSLAYYYSYRV